MEQNRQLRKNIVLLWVVLCTAITIFSLLFIVLATSLQNNNLTANDIYDRCVYNVVEVKAETDNIGTSYGTGEVISSNGDIVTNAHVVTYTRVGATNEFERCYVRFAFEDDYRTVTLVKYDTNLDLAILKITDLSDLTLQPIKFGNSDELHSGDRVYAVGNASNYGIGIFEGMVSIPLVNIELDNLTRSVIQCDLTIAAGNSGGALLDERGRLVGITTFRTKDTSGNVIYGIVYCIPVNAVLEYINS